MQKSQVIRNGQVLNAPAHTVEPRDILIQAGRIVELGQPGMVVPPETPVVDATDRLLMPGLINAHTHGHGAIGKGLGDRWTLELLLNAGSWLNGDRSIEHKYLSTKVGALEMLAKGCTACYDLYFEYPAPSPEGMQAVAQAYRDAGMRAVVAPMIADKSFYEAIPGLLDALPKSLRDAVTHPSSASQSLILQACRESLASNAFDSAFIRGALAPTIPLHCSDEFIVACRDLADEMDVGLHMHLAESKVQAVAGLKKYGKTLTAHLDDLGFLSDRFTGAHCVWLDEEDMKRIGGHGGAIAHNPGSNLRLGSGIAPARQMMAAGVNVGIGTDGGHCSDNQNMFEAMRFTSFVSRVRDHDPDSWLTTEQVLDMATTGSARTLGFGDDLGRLAPGACADITFIDLAHVNYWPLNDPSNQLVHTENGAAVASVMVDGELILDNGRFVREDMSKVRADVAEAAETLAVANAERRQLSEKLATAVSGFCIGLARQPYHVHGMATVGESRIID